MPVAVRIELPGEDAVDRALGHARALGLLGWVRHDDDGATRVHAEGEPEAVDELVAALGGTAERVKPEGHEQFAVRGVPHGAFLVREHAGGFDLVLEVGDTLRVWTLRKAPEMDPSVKRMAFEAAPSDGATWDAGPYEQGGRVPWPEALDRGHAVFVLHGERLRGGWALQRTRPGQWLLIKRRDAAVR